MKCPKCKGRMVPDVNVPTDEKGYSVIQVGWLCIECHHVTSLKVQKLMERGTWSE